MDHRFTNSLSRIAWYTSEQLTSLSSPLEFLKDNPHFTEIMYGTILPVFSLALCTFPSLFTLPSLLLQRLRLPHLFNTVFWTSTAVLTHSNFILATNVNVSHFVPGTLEL